MMTNCSLIPDFSTRKIQAQNMLCTKIVLNAKTKTKNIFCTQHVLNLYLSIAELIIRNSMNNLSSYCGLTGTRMSASDTDLPVRKGNLMSNSPTDMMR